jgi:hypothetical protein
LTTDECKKAEAEVADVINDAFIRAGADPFPVLFNDTQSLPAGRLRMGN